MTATASAPTVWLKVPPRPPQAAGRIVATSTGGLALAGKRVFLFGPDIDFQAILSLLNQKNGVWSIDPAQQAVWSAQLDNLDWANCVRLHGLDNVGEPNIYANPGPPTSTLSFNAACLQALDWFIAQLEARGIWYTLELHYKRQLVASDLGINPSDLAKECLSDSFNGAPKALMSPWMFYDTGTLLSLFTLNATALLQHVNQYTRIPIGLGHGLAALEVTNENSLAKTASWGYDAHPALNTAFDAKFGAWCAAHGLAVAKAGATEHAQFAAFQESQFFAAVIQAIRLRAPGVLVIASQHFGDGPYAMLQSHYDNGDALAAHFYSYQSKSELVANGGPGNGFLYGQSAASQRSRYAAVLAGCTWPGKPLFLTECAPVCQFTPNALDPPAELAQFVGAAIGQAIAQDVAAWFLYAEAIHAVFAERSPFASIGPYDEGKVPAVMCQLPGWSAQFQNPDLRLTTAISVKPTNGVFGGEAKGSQFGPYTDPALYAVPGGQKVVMSI